MVISKRLRIRPIDRSDLRQIVPIHSDPLVNKYLPYETWQNDSDAQAWFAREEKLAADGTAQQFVIELLQTNKIIGTCILMHHDQQLSFARFGYVLGRKDWGKGYMFEAMTAFIDYLHHQLKINTLQAMVEEENIASVKLLEKLGFRLDPQNRELAKENLFSFTKKLTNS